LSLKLQDLFTTLNFVLIAFLSLLFHDLGHALMGRRLGGSDPNIELRLFGGVTQFTGKRLRSADRIKTIAAGPIVGFLIAGMAGLVILISGLLSGLPTAVSHVVEVIFWVNIVWSTLNLLPIIPLDGGMMLADLLGPGSETLVRIVSYATIGFLFLLALFRLDWFAICILVLLGVNQWRQVEPSPA
ncbi:MAG: site-2 protease family protein, partial [Verrucomicrobiota bacterium]